ncbi:MAG TPA: molybdopterin-binding protein [Nitrososphaera sp.]|jgi:molybdenum cofactor synthesis domain-containing protein
MIIEILCVGNELLSGITLNSNAHWLAGQIAAAGGVVKRVNVVRDDLPEISATVRETLARKPDILLITGGLGVTYDDMTLEGVALALDKKMVLDSRAVGMLKKSYAVRKLDYELTEARLKMAKIPEGSTPIQNLLGSAPGVTFQAGETKIFCLQGVPREMKAIFEKHVMPLLKKGVGRFVALEVNYNVRAVTEAMIAPALASIVGSHPKEAIYLKTHPQGHYRKKTPQIRIQLISRGSDRKEVKRRLGGISKTIEQEVARLGGRIC